MPHRSLRTSPATAAAAREMLTQWDDNDDGRITCAEARTLVFFILNREDFSFVIHLDRQPRTSRRREAQTWSRARSGSRSERTLDAVEHSRTPSCPKTQTNSRLARRAVSIVIDLWRAPVLGRVGGDVGDFGFPVRAGKTTVQQRMHAPGETWIQARAAPGPGTC